MTTPDPARSATASAAAASNGLAPHVAAVEAARARLGSDLDVLNREVRAQMGQTAQETTWKLAATGSAIVAGVLARKIVMAGYTKAKHTTPPTNPAGRQTQWSEALTWTIATSIVVGLARLVATRGIAGAWEKLTGHLPPGMEEVSP